MLKLRMIYEKTGNMKYLGHLDVVRIFTRAAKRSGLPFWITEGFNPHIYLNFTMPLPLGVAGAREICDFKFTGPAVNIPDRLNEYLPERLKVLSVEEPGIDAADAAFSCFEFAFPDVGKEELTGFFEKNGIIALKKNKPVDIRPLFEGVDMTGGVLTLKFSNLSPTLFLSALFEHLDRRVFYTCRRTGLFTADGRLI